MTKVDAGIDSFSNVQLLHCPDCFFMSMSVSKMCEHFFNHQESVEWQIYKCNECGIISSHEDLLNEHMIMKHRDSKNTINQENSKSILVDTVYTQELPQGYSIEGELTPKHSYREQYICCFCKTVVTDPAAMKAHLEISHDIRNVENVSKFLVKIDNCKKEMKLKKLKIQPSENNFNTFPAYNKKLKQEEVVATNSNATLSPVSQAPPPSTCLTSQSPLIFSYNQLAEQTVAKVITQSPTDPTKVILCPEDAELKMELPKDTLVQSYDPEPLRFLRHLVRAGIPIDELVNFSWKGNRRGRPRHVTTESPTSLSMLPPLGPAPSCSFQTPRRSMKDDPRMRAFCWAVEKLTKKPLPENLGTHMHQFLSNLRNKAV